MGTRGPAPTPTKILEARGSWRAKTRAGELQFPVERPECPAWLSTEARAEWDRVAKACDAPALACMCEWWAEHQRARRALRNLAVSHKRYYQTLVGSGIAWSNFDKIAARFGLTPVDRAKLRLPKKPDPAASVSNFARRRDGSAGQPG